MTDRCIADVQCRLNEARACIISLLANRLLVVMWSAITFGLDRALRMSGQEHQRIGGSVSRKFVTRQAQCRGGDCGRRESLATERGLPEKAVLTPLVRKNCYDNVTSPGPISAHGAWDRCYKNTGNAACCWLPSSTPEIESGESPHVSGALPHDHQIPTPMHYFTTVYAKATQGLALFSASLALQMTAAIGQTDPGPTAHGPYTVSVFAPPPAGLTNPDSITVGFGNIFVTYANASQPDGSAGSSTVVQYGPRGKMIRRYTIVGKNDGLKFDPRTGKIWALRNEDANPALTIIDPRTGQTTDYTYAQRPAHGGGYDDVAFIDDKIYISASNPTTLPATPTTPNGQNVFPSIVRAHLSGHLVFVRPVLNGAAPLIDIATGQTVVSQQSDPDSLKVDPFGGLVLDSQADGDLIFLYSPGTRRQTSFRLHLTNGTSKQITVDDTVFPTTPSGAILVVDTAGDTVYAVRSNAFQPGGAYSASDSDGILGKVDLSTGLVTPIVTGMKSPHGALFISATGNDNDSDKDDDQRDRDDQ